MTSGLLFVAFSNDNDGSCSRSQLFFWKTNKQTSTMMIDRNRAAPRFCLVYLTAPTVVGERARCFHGCLALFNFWDCRRVSRQEPFVRVIFHILYVYYCTIDSNPGIALPRMMVSPLLVCDDHEERGEQRTHGGGRRTHHSAANTKTPTITQDTRQP